MREQQIPMQKYAPLHKVNTLARGSNFDDGSGRAKFLVYVHARHRRRNASTHAVPICCSIYYFEWSAKQRRHLERNLYYEGFALPHAIPCGESSIHAGDVRLERRYQGSKVSCQSWRHRRSLRSVMLQRAARFQHSIREG